MSGDTPISFARGAPGPELIPSEELADCAHEVGLRDGTRVFSYGPGGGYAPLREWVAECHGVDETGVHALATGRAMNVGGIDHQ